VTGLSEYQEKYGHLYDAVDPSQLPTEEIQSEAPKHPKLESYREKYGHLYSVASTPTATATDEDPYWSDYGRMVAAGGIQLGAGVGWLFNNFDWGESLQEGSVELSESIMEGLSPQAKEALQTEFTVRDEGQLWTNKKWSRAKLIAAQSLLGTAAGMGVGSVLTRGLAIAGMTRVATTAAGAAVQVPSKTAGAIGYGLGEAGVAAPGSAASVESEIMAMSHDELMKSADYQAVFASLEGSDADKQRRAKEYLAKAAAGDTFARNIVSTFILSAPLGVFVGGYAGKVPMFGATTRGKSIALGAAGEATQEFLQSGAEKIGENIAMQQVDPTRETFGGALEEAVGGALAGGMMGGAMGVVSPLDPKGAQVLPDAESPLAALARQEQDELDAALDAELAEMDAAEREAEDQALRDMLDEQDALEVEAIRGFEMAGMETERTRQLDRQPPTEEIEAYKSVEQIHQEEEEYLAEHPEITEKEIKGPLEGKDRAPGRYTEAGFLVEQRETRLETQDEREAREREVGFREIERERENQRLLDYAEAGEEIEKSRIGGAPTVTQLTPRVGLDEEQLRRTGGQPAEGEVVAGLPVETAGRLGVSLKEHMLAAGIEEPEPDEPGAAPEPEPEPEPEPGIGYADTRLRDEETQGHLQNMADELEARSGGELVPDADFIGGESDKRTDEGGYEAPLTRLPSRNPEWFKRYNQKGGIGAGVQYVKNIVDKALAGKRLGSKQKLILQDMLDEIDEQRAASEREMAPAEEVEVETKGPQLKLREKDQEELDNAAFDVGEHIKRYGPITDETPSMVRNEVLADLYMLRQHKDPRAAELGAKLGMPAEERPTTREEFEATPAEEVRQPGEPVPQLRAPDEKLFDESLESIKAGRGVEAFPKPKGTKKKANIENKAKNAGFISDEEADATVQSWKVEAGRIGDTQDNSKRIILSLFDESGVWSEPWALAGYQVVQLDLNFGDDILDEHESPNVYIAGIEASVGGKVEGILAACPCNSFSGAGARWWASQHDKPNREMVRKKYGDAAAENYDTPVDYANMLVMTTGLYVEMAGPRFHVLENPVGRLPEVTGLPGPATQFQPHNFGNPYTKRTQLWGEFNTDMPTANVEPNEGSKMHKLRGDDPKQKKQRSITPEGFAYSFFIANHTDGPALDTKRIEQMRNARRMERTQPHRRQPLGETGIEEEPEAELPTPNEAREQRRQEIREQVARGEERREAERGTPERRVETEAETEAREEREAIQAESMTELESVKQEIATAPESDRPLPSDAQLKAENYKKAKRKLLGIPTVIENTPGSDRNGFTQTQVYGGFEGTEGMDGDAVDFFANPKTFDSLAGEDFDAENYAGKVYVIDQVDENSRPDEHKVMLGYANQLAAVKAYKSNYEKGWTVGPVTEMSLAEFKTWLANAAATKRPVQEGGITRDQHRARRKLLRSAKEKNDARFEDAQESVNAPNQKWVADVLGTTAETIEASEIPLVKLVRELTSLDEELTQLEEYEAEGRAYGRSEISRDTVELRESMPKANIRILDSYKQAPVDVVLEMEERGLTEIRAVFNPRTGETYVFSDKIRNTEDAHRAIVHETTHQGLRIAFGDTRDPMLLSLANKIPAKLQDMADTIVKVYKLDLTKEQDQIEMAEELATHGAELYPNLNIIQRIIANVRMQLRKISAVKEWTENDVIGVILSARGAIKRRGRSLDGITLDEDVEVEETGEIFTIEQDAQGLLAQNEQRRKVCEKLKKCL